MLNKSKIILPTDEEDAVIQKGINSDPEAYELTEDNFKKMRPASEALPHIVESYRAMRGRQKKPTKLPTTIRLSPEVVDYFKATGKGWQTRMDAVLKDYVATH